MYDVQRSTFRKQELIVSRRLIEMLFGGGQSLSMAAYPLRAVYMLKERQEGETPVQLLVSVPKKKFKHAVDRNRVKRQVREAYRYHKQLLTSVLPANQQMLLAFVWLSDEHRPSSEIEGRVVSLIKRISEKL